MNIDVKKAGLVLNDKTASLSNRFRALFMLRNASTNEAVNAIVKCLVDKSDLLNHELAYCLGQMKNPTAIPHLSDILANDRLAVILRHEAGEALGAIGQVSSLPVLQKYVNDPCQEVAETCQLAISRIKWFEDCDYSKEGLIPSPFSSVDPTPSGPCSDTDISNLEDILTNENNMLFERYRAMFSLRNLHNDKSASALTRGLFCRDSALLRHEVAYVLGQMQLSVAVPALLKSLSDINEHSMVRHESAEALGSIADERCLDALKKFLSDPSDVVRESCEVALDMYKHETEEFNYVIKDTRFDTIDVKPLG